VTESVGVALIGYGYWGANLARNIRAIPELRLVGIADHSDEQRAAANAAHPDVTVWESLDQALGSESVDAVVLAVPASRHGASAIEVLKSGRHVLVEKPLSMDVAEARQIVALGEQVSRVVMVGHTFLYSPAVRFLRSLIDRGDLGEIQYVYSQRLSLGRIRRDCNALWNFAPHDVSIMLHLLDRLPTEVSATSMAMIDPDVADVFFANLSFPSSVGAHLHVSWIDPRKTRLMTIVGDEKMAIYNDVSVDQKVWIVDAGVSRSNDFGDYESLGDFQWRTRAGDIVIPKIEMSEPLRNEMAAFADACVTGRPPLTSGQHGVDVVAILAAIDESARRRGSPIEVST